MEKDSYETYEYLPASTSDGLTETNQFFVVQDDGTFLSKFKDYALKFTKLKDFRSVFTSRRRKYLCKQFSSTGWSKCRREDGYRAVFRIPELNPSSVYRGVVEGDQGLNMEEDVVVDGMCDINQHRETEEEIKQVSPYTEVTLTESQYHTLEQKGWILLETLEKTFLLDTVGLHDITNNEDLIQNLKREIELDALQENSASLVVNENGLDNLKNEPEITSEGESVHLTSETLTLIRKDDGIIELKPPSESDGDVNVEDIEQIADPPAKPEDNILRIKTTLNLKDIPNKIVLGKTVSGKKLVARMKSKYTFAKKTTENPQNGKDNADSSKIAESGEITPTDAQFKELMDKAQKSQYLTPPKAISESLINLIVNQLIKMPSFQKNDYSLVITKEKKIDTGTDSRNFEYDLPPCLVTGSIRAVGNAWKFHHQPHVLFQFDPSNKDESQTENEKRDILYNILHVHVMEMKKVDNIEKICMTVNRRYLPLAAPKIDIALACSECARVFKAQEEYDEHLKNHKPAYEESEKTVGTQQIKLEGPSKKLIYSCIMCEASFDRRSSCERHLKTHAQPEKSEDKEESDQPESKGKQFQCKMCPCSYVFSASLSKHIKETHVKVKGTVK